MISLFYSVDFVLCLHEINVYVVCKANLEDIGSDCSVVMAQVCCVFHSLEIFQLLIDSFYVTSLPYRNAHMEGKQGFPPLTASYF